MIDELLCGLNAKAQSEITSILKKQSKILEAILFGSRAKGTFKPGSDIDIALKAPDLNLSESLALGMEIDDLLLAYKVDLIVIHQIDNEALLDHINRVGKLLFTKNG